MIPFGGDRRIADRSPNRFYDRETEGRRGISVDARDTGDYLDRDRYENVPRRSSASRDRFDSTRSYGDRFEHPEMMRPDNYGYSHTIDRYLPGQYQGGDRYSRDRNYDLNRSHFETGSRSQERLSTRDYSNKVQFDPAREPAGSQERRPSLVRRSSVSRSPSGERRPSVGTGNRRSSVSRSPPSERRPSVGTANIRSPVSRSPPRERRPSVGTGNRRSSVSRSPSCERRPSVGTGNIRRSSMSRSVSRERKPSLAREQELDPSRLETRRLSTASRRSSGVQEGDMMRAAGRRPSMDIRERPFGMQSAVVFQRGGQVGAQFGSDRMPPPIPPFAECRSNYPTTMVS